MFLVIEEREHEEKVPQRAGLPAEGGRPVPPQRVGGLVKPQLQEAPARGDSQRERALVSRDSPFRMG